MTLYVASVTLNVAKNNTNAICRNINAKYRTPLTMSFYVYMKYMCVCSRVRARACVCFYVWIEKERVPLIKITSV